MYDESSGPNKRPHVEDTSMPAVGWNPGRRKKSGKRGQRKQAEVLPLVGILNETTDIQEKPVFIQQLLKGMKVDISLLDLVAWSPTSCKEVKRLCTYVTKKKKPKDQESSDPAQIPMPPNSHYPATGLPGFFTMFPPMPQQPAQISFRPTHIPMNPDPHYQHNLPSQFPAQQFYHQGAPP